MTGVLEALHAHVGTTCHSDWLLIDQAMVDRFADATLDHQFIHVDADRAAATDFGGTIAHGFLSLSLLPYLQASMPQASVPGPALNINYGLDRVRFICPVRTGSRIRAAATLVAVAEKRAGCFQQTHEFAIEIAGEDKPALVATWITQFHV